MRNYFLFFLHLVIISFVYMDKVDRNKIIGYLRNHSFVDLDPNFNFNFNFDNTYNPIDYDTNKYYFYFLCILAMVVSCSAITPLFLQNENNERM